MPQHRKFSWKKVCELREWWSDYQSIPSLTDVAEREGVNPSVIRDLCEGRTYRREAINLDAIAEGLQENGFTWSEKGGECTQPSQ